MDIFLRALSAEQLESSPGSREEKLVIQGRPKEPASLQFLHLSLLSMNADEFGYWMSVFGNARGADIICHKTLNSGVEKALAGLVNVLGEKTCFWQRKEGEFEDADTIGTYSNEIEHRYTKEALPDPPDEKLVAVNFQG